MIIDAIVTLLAGVLEFVGGLFGSIPVPGFVAAIDGSLSEVAGYAAGFGNIFPFADAIAGGTFVIACIGIGFAIKVIRIVVSLFTAGGGSAG